MSLPSSHIIEARRGQAMYAIGVLQRYQRPEPPLVSDKVWRAGVEHLLQRNYTRVNGQPVVNLQITKVIEEGGMVVVLAEHDPVFLRPKPRGKPGATHRMLRAAWTATTMVGGLPQPQFT